MDEEVVGVEQIAKDIRKNSGKPWIAGTVSCPHPLHVHLQYKKNNANWHSYEIPGGTAQSTDVFRDATYRSKIKAIDGKRVVVNLNLYDLGIIDEVKQIMNSSSDFFRVELIQLSAYSKEYPPPSPPYRSKSNDPLATVLVVLPIEFRGGNLVLSSEKEGKHEETKWSWTRDGTLNWLAYTAGYEYAVQKITKGMCVMLVYELSEAAKPSSTNFSSLSTAVFIGNDHVEQLQPHTTLGFPCRNAYYELLLGEKVKLKGLEKVLKGEDRALYQAAERSSLIEKVELVKIWEEGADSEYDQSDKQFFVDRVFGGGFVNSKYTYNRDCVYDMAEMLGRDDVVSGDHIAWSDMGFMWVSGATHLWEESQVDEGGEKKGYGTMTVRCAAAILLTVKGKPEPKSRKRKLTTGEKKGGKGKTRRVEEEKKHKAEHEKVAENNVEDDEETADEGGT